MKITKAPTKTELIITALKNIIQKNKIKSLKSYKGKIDLDINLDTLGDRREKI